MIVSLLGSGCAEEEVLQKPGSTANVGTVAYKNFSILFSEVDPTVIDPETGIFKETSVDVTAHIGDRNNETITNPHTIYFKSEYGLIEPSCVTDETGSCSVIWHAIKRPEAGGPGSDGYTTIVAYTSGEESFTDNNGNGIFDDNDAGTFNDLEEPYINLNLRSDLNDNIFDGNDVVIDTVNGNDLTGANGVHDIGDGLFNGGGCTHSSLCSSTVRNAMIWVAAANSIIGTPTWAYTVGGTISGLTGSVTLQNNSADGLIVAADGSFTFATAIDDGGTYSVTVSVQPAGQTCTVTNGSGTINTANVTTVTVACT